MKQKILGLLRATSAPLSGTALSKALSVSRVAVWKHIEGLREAGYEIRGTAEGYVLETEGDFMFPWELGAWEKRSHFFSTIDSTMTAARDLAEKGCLDGTIVLAEEQSAGRGRMQRSWNSCAGGIYMSLIQKPDLPLQVCTGFNFLASLSLAKTLREKFGIPATVKWPNDVLVHGRKIAGILTEVQGEADMIKFLSIGIGINVNNDPKRANPLSCSLQEVKGSPISRARIIQDFLAVYEKEKRLIGSPELLQAWKSYSCTIGRSVRIQLPGETLEGTALGVDALGGLKVKDRKGIIHTVVFGDCEYRDRR